MEYSYYEVRYVSCESNERWYIARCPIDWSEYDLRSNIQLGGCGDDVAEIVEITPSYEPSDGIYHTYGD